MQVEELNGNACTCRRRAHLEACWCGVWAAGGRAASLYVSGPHYKLICDAIAHACSLAMHTAGEEATQGHAAGAGQGAGGRAHARHRAARAARRRLLQRTLGLQGAARLGLGGLGVGLGPQGGGAPPARSGVTARCGGLLLG